jgi:hypothetical protein
MESGVPMRAVQRAAEIVGGSESLAAYLNVPSTWITSWMEGASPVPQSQLMRVVGIILDQGTACDRGVIPDSLVPSFRHRDAANG